jgi:alkylation response protein AidB-like acyl-CoA dehydrogenase
MASAMSMVESLVRDQQVGGRSAIEDDLVRDQFVTLQTEVILFRRMCKKMVEDLVRHGGTGPESSILNVFYSELLQRMMAFGVSLAGLDTHRLTFKPVSAGYESGRWMLDYIDSFAWVIAGGTNEIQRSLIGERVLGLPREPMAS